MGNKIQDSIVNIVEGAKLQPLVLAKIFIEVHEFFEEQGEPEKAWLWFKSENPFFGNISPLLACIMGKEDKVLSWVQNQRELDKR